MGFQTPLVLTTVPLPLDFNLELPTESTSTRLSVRFNRLHLVLRTRVLDGLTSIPKGVYSRSSISVFPFNPGPELTETYWMSPQTQRLVGFVFCVKSFTSDRFPLDLTSFSSSLSLSVVHLHS